ncbi:MAG: hypothetical protein IJ377_02205 [Rikenellaceae bacterium]|nr:hypothetical protein [Rikenellaceae bacterium]
MKPRISLFLLVAMIFCAACSDRSDAPKLTIVPEGEIITQTRTFDIASIEATLREGNTYGYLTVENGMEVLFDEELPDGTIEVTTHENIQPYVDVVVSTLYPVVRIRLNYDYEYDHASVKLRMSPNLFFAFDGSHFIFKDEVAKRKMAFLLSKNSYVELSGSCEIFSVILNGGTMNVTNMNVATAHMSLMNDAKISTINISESLTGYLTSGSKLYYKGTPAEMEIQVSDGAELIKCD